MSYAVGVYGRSGTLTLNNCNIKGNRNGVVNEANLYVNGGTYEGYLYGGYRITSSGETWIQNATIKHCEKYGKYESTESYGVGFYIGAPSGTNVKVNIDSCNIYGPQNPILILGSEEGQSHILNISNSTINTDAKIRIDSDEHKLFIGRGCNFNADNTDRAVCVTRTEEVYIKEEN